MLYRLKGMVRHTLRALAYSALGATVVLVVGFILYLNSREDLSIWHQARLDEEFTSHSDVTSFADYLALEERLFRQLDERVYARVKPQEGSDINRYARGSLSDPQRWTPNWNRSYEMQAESAQAYVLLLHGMSDSPYSLRHLAESLHAGGAHVLGLRIPGHGTAPSGLVDVAWQDMTAAVRLAVHHLAQQANGRPLYLVGYSNGGALAVHYVLTALEDETLPQIARMAILSPEIGVTPVAKLAVWQARLGHLLGLDKLAWNDILPEYDPFKYGSFAVNAGNVAYQLTSEIQDLLAALEKEHKLDKVPPILAFSSIVDATVSAPALVKGLFMRLPAGGHELVLFDINRRAGLESLMKSNPSAVIQTLQTRPERNYTLSAVVNKNTSSQEVVLRTKKPGEAAPTESKLNLSWPRGVYSLSHVALPFPADDSLYGGRPEEKTTELHLGNLALRGERGVLQISASDMLRLRWNPFYPFIESRVLKFIGVARAQDSEK